MGPLYFAGMSSSNRLRIAAIAACYNEAGNIPELCQRILAAFDAARVTGQILVVDDGSTDDTSGVLRSLANDEPRIGFVRLSRNFGQQAAFSAGLDHVDADAVILLDGDLQDPPELIENMIERYREGFEVVYAVRERRSEPLWKRSAYRYFYALLSSTADIHIPENAGDFGLMSRRVVETIRASGERHRFVRGLRSWAGFRQIALPYDRPTRSSGKPKYTLGKLLKLAMDGLVAFSSAPLQAATWFGFVTVAGAAAYLLYGLVSRLFLESVPPGWTSLIAVIVGMGGVQLVMLGLIGEYIARIYDEVKGRPVYVVEERNNIAAPESPRVVGVEPPPRHASE